MFPTYAKWFSNIGRLVAPPRFRTRTAGQLGQDPRPEVPVEEEPAAGSPAGETATAAEPVPAAQEDASKAVSGSTTAAPAAVSLPRVLSADETKILQMYQSWVELDNGVAQAHEDLQRILNSRGKAAVLRSQAQEKLEQAEAVREEAQRIGDAAWRAFDRGFATNIRGFANRRAMVREIDQSRKTQAELQRTVHKNAWEEAERSREAATAQVLKALNALAMVADQVERELAEAASLPKLADALQDAAREELRCAEAVKDELLLLGREALNQLGVTPTSDHGYVTVEPPAPEAGNSEPGNQGLILGDGGPGFDAGPEPLAEETPSFEQVADPPQVVSDSLSWEAESAEPLVEGTVIIDADPGMAESAAVPLLEETLVEEPPATVSQPVIQPPAPPPKPEPVISEPATTPEPEISVSASSPSAQDLLREMEEARAFVESSQSSATPAPEPATPESGQLQSPRPESPIEGEIIFPKDKAATPEPPRRPSRPPSRPVEGNPSAAEQLIRDMEAARAAMQPPQPSPAVETPHATQDLILDMPAFGSPPAEDEPETATPPANVPAPVPAPQVSPDSAPEPAARPPETNRGRPAEASYSGRLYLMFPSTLTQDQMGMVWEALEDVARGSQILDSRLLSASEGIQFTVELGAAGLVVKSLSGRLLGAEFEGLEPDRLKVNWPKR